MLYITTKKGTIVLEWHVGEPVPANLPRVVTFQADGDELELILHAMDHGRRREKETPRQPFYISESTRGY